MNTGLKKSLRISGILFLVAIITFGIVYGALSILRVGKIYASAFEGCDEKLDNTMFTPYLKTDSTKAFNLANNLEQHVNIEYNYYLSYYSGLKLNSSQSSELKKQINSVKQNIANLNQSYDLFKILFEYNEATPVYKDKINDSIYTNYLDKYAKTLSARLSLNKTMKNILNKNNVVLNLYIASEFEISNLWASVAMDVTFPHYIKKYNADSTSAKINSYFINAINIKTRMYLPISNYIPNYASLNEKTIKIQTYNTNYNDFKTALNKLTDVEESALFNSINYTEDATGNLKIVFDFLKDLFE